MKYRVMLVETVRYSVDVEAADEHEAAGLATDLWVQSSNPDAAFDGQGEGVEADDILSDPPNWKPILVTSLDGWQVRHDLHGWYVCSDEEAAHEDAGNSSVGFDGRDHWSTVELACEALAEIMS